MIATLLVALSLVSAAPATKTVTSKDSGKTITISKQQGLHIDLDECVSCGYRWRTTAKPNPKVLTRRSSTTSRDCPPPPPDPGKPSFVCGTYTRVFRYIGKSTGSTKIRLEYFGPAKKKSSDAFRITVRVR
jgi:predicted secreted protein